jgi:hypothetical protein
MDKRFRQKYTSMPLRKLRRLAADLEKLIKELEGTPLREIDIAAEHSGDPALVAQVLRTHGSAQDRQWFQVERIYCSIERCPSCPHGDFKYRYQRRKDGTFTKKYICKMAVNGEIVEWMKSTVTQGHAYELKTLSNGESGSRDPDRHP